MSARSQFDQISAQLKSIYHQRDVVNQQAFTLEEGRGQLIFQLIKEEQMLKDTRWELVLTSRGEPRLHLLQRTPGIEQILEITSIGFYHYSYPLVDGIEFCFDDQEIKIDFRDIGQIVPFTQEHSMTFTAQGLKDRLSQLAKELFELNALANEIGV